MVEVHAGPVSQVRTCANPDPGSQWRGDGGARGGGKKWTRVARKAKAKWEGAEPGSPSENGRKRDRGGGTRSGQGGGSGSGREDNPGSGPGGGTGSGPGSDLLSGPGGGTGSGSRGGNGSDQEGGTWSGSGSGKLRGERSGTRSGVQSRSGREKESSEVMRVGPIWGRRSDRGVRKEDSKNPKRHKRRR